MHLTGVLSHGHELAFAFLDFMQWPHDSNLTINVLLLVLLKVAKVCMDIWPKYPGGTHDILARGCATVWSLY